MKLRLTSLLPAAALFLLAAPTPSADAAPSPKAKKSTKTRKSTRGPKARKGKPKATKVGKAGKITKAKKIKLKKAHVSPPKDPTPGSIKGNGGGGGLPPGPGSVQTNDDGELSFVLSANQPFVKFAGRLMAHYPRDWETSAHREHGEVWISNHRLPGETYVKAFIFVQPGYEYRVDVCVSANNNESLVARVGDTTTNFDAGHDDEDCNLPLLLESGETGWTSIQVGIAHNDPGAFALDRFEVRRTKK